MLFDCLQLLPICCSTHPLLACPPSGHSRSSPSFTLSTRSASPGSSSLESVTRLLKACRHKRLPSLPQLPAQDALTHIQTPTFSFIQAMDPHSIFRHLLHTIDPQPLTHDAASGVASTSGLDTSLSFHSNGRCPEEARVGTELRRAVKPKKMHEIVRLSELAHEVASLSECSEIVDLGSGQARRDPCWRASVGTQCTELCFVT